VTGLYIDAEHVMPTNQSRNINKISSIICTCATCRTTSDCRQG